jgi:hypothetical protein
MMDEGFEDLLCPGLSVRLQLHSLSFEGGFVGGSEYPAVSTRGLVYGAIALHQQA